MKFKIGKGDVNDIKKMIEEMTKDKDRKVMKSVPATEAQLKEWKEWTDFADQIEKDYAKVMSLKKKFWATVEIELNEFTHTLGMNETDKCIEVYANDDEKEVPGQPVKSPFQI